MEFYLEPSGSITISCGDLLLTTSNNYEKMWIATMMTNANEIICFTAADKVMTGDLYFAHDKGISLTIYNDRIFKMLRDSVSSDRWYLVPYDLWADITPLIDRYVY